MVKQEVKQEENNKRSGGFSDVLRKTGGRLRKLPGKAKAYVLRGGLSESMYRQVAVRCLHENVETQKIVALMGFIVSVLYVTLSATGLMGNFKLLAPYSVLLVMTLILTVIGRQSSRLSQRQQLEFLYVAEATGLVFGALLGTYFSSANTEAVTFCCLIVAYGFIMVDIPARFNASILAGVVLFTVLEVRFKSEDTHTMNTDLLNAWSFGAVSVLINGLFIGKRFHTYMQQIMYEKEKDTDALSGLLTKDALHLVMEGSMEDRVQGTCILFDLDHFKEVNDTYGHLFGDEVIAYTGAMIRHHLDRRNISGRFGGDEFIIFLPDTDLETGVRTAEDILKTFLDNQGQLAHSNLGLAFSAGVVNTWEGVTYQELFEKVDAVMYKAKRAGGDRVAFEEMHGRAGVAA